MSNMLEHARDEYRRLLRLPLGGWERHYNQAYLAFLRDFIAEMEGRDPQAVQEEYEGAAQL
jgi:hypothetical protein